MQKEFLTKQDIKDLVMNTNEMASMSEVEQYSNLMSPDIQTIEVAEIGLEDLNEIEANPDDTTLGVFLVVDAKPVGLELENDSALIELMEEVALSPALEGYELRTSGKFLDKSGVKPPAALYTDQAYDYLVGFALKDEIGNEVDWAKGVFASGKFKVGFRFKELPGEGLSSLNVKP